MPIIQSVERALLILNLFDEHSTEIKITEISERIGLHKSTVHSLLKTLQKHHYIARNPENGKYKLGMKLVERGNFVISTMDIRQVARKYLVDLSKKTGQTTHLGILDGREAVYIDKVEGQLALISYSRIGRSIPLHTTAVGKVLLAFQDPKEIQQILNEYEYTKQTAYAITDKTTFEKELEKVRLQGYAVDDQENLLGVRCIAVPIFNFKKQILAALSISTLVPRVNNQEIEEYIKMLKKTGHDLSAEVGFGLSNMSS